MTTAIGGPAEFQEHLKRLQSTEMKSEEKFELSVRIFTSGFLAVSQQFEKLTAEVEKLTLQLAKANDGSVKQVKHQPGPRLMPSFKAAIDGDPSGELK